MNTERNKVEEILGSLDNIKRTHAPDFFYTRLKARLEKESGKDERRSWVLRPAYALITLVLVLLVNAFVLLQRNNEVSATTADNESVSTSIAAEYSLNDNGALYEINQER